MGQSLAGIYSVAQGYEPFIQGIPHTPRYGFEGAPFLQQMGIGALLAQPFLGKAMGAMSMVPMGVGHDQNVYDIIKNQQFTQAQQIAMAEAAQADRQRFFQTFRGMAALTGTPFGAEQRRAANALADVTAFVSPMAAYLAPDVLEQMAGLRGSATIMTQRMMEASRYRSDPVTGKIGMSGESAGLMARQIYADLYEGNNFRQMQGVTAGQLGDLFSQLQHRGLIERSDVSRRAMAQSTIEGLARDRPDMYEGAVRRLVSLGADRGGLSRMPADATKLTADELDKLSLDPAVADRLRSFDAEKIKRSLKNYVGAVGAMRDIFGDMGRPDAPMRELITGLEALTGGGVGKLNPQQLSLMARQTYNLAKQVGATMDSVMVLQQHVGQRGQQLGLEPVFAAQATQGALGFGGAYRSMGHAAHTAWGAMNADQLTQADANLRVQASASIMANRLGATMRLSQTAGGFREGSEAAAMVEAIRRRQTEYAFGGAVKSLNMADTDFFDILSRAEDKRGRKLGISENMIRDIVDQHDANREFIHQHGIGDIVRRSQGREEVQPFIADRLINTLMSRLQGKGVDRQQASVDVGRMAGSAVERIFQMSTADFSDNERRTAAISRIMAEGLRGTATGARLANMSEADRENFFRLTSDQFMGDADRAIRQTGFAGLESMQNVHRLFNQETLAESTKQQEQARFTSRLQEAMSPLGRGSALQRAMQFLQDIRPDDKDNVQKLIAQAFGGVKREDISKAIMQPLEELHERRNLVEELRRQISVTTDPAERGRLEKQLDDELESLGQQSAQLAKVSEQHGYFADGGISRDEARRIIRQNERVSDTISDLAGISGGFGTRVSAKELADAKKEWNSSKVTASRTEAMAVMLARRKNLLHSLRTGEDSDIVKQHMEEAKRLIKHTQGKDISDTEARSTAIDMIKDRLYEATDAEIENVRNSRASNNMITTDAEAEALVLARRQETAPRATDEQVAAVRKQFNNLNAKQARMLADARQRAKRFGISEEEIKSYMQEHDDPILRDKNNAPVRVAALDEYSAIIKATQIRDVTQWNVSAEDVELFKKKNTQFANRFTGDYDAATGEYAAITDADKKLEAEKNRQEIIGKILRERQAEKVERFQKFFQSEDGARFREDVDMASQDTENVISKLVQGPEMVRRMGTRAIEIHQRLRAIEQRRRDLAAFYTRGDQARLRIGQIGADESTDEGRRTITRVRDQVESMRLEEQALLREVESPTSTSRPVRVGDATAAWDDFALNIGDYVKGKTLRDNDMRELAGKHAAWIRAGKGKDSQFVDPSTGRQVSYTMDEFNRFHRVYQENYEQQARERQGDIELARERFGFRPGQSLTEEQQADVNRLSATFTQERERAESGGRSFRIGSVEDAYEHFVANINQYVAGQPDHKDLLEIAAARQAWWAAGQPANNTNFTYENKKYSFTHADNLRMRDVFKSHYQEAAQERAGDVQEAMHVLGLQNKKYEELSDAEKKKVDDMSFSVGVARRVKTEDEQQLEEFMRRDASLNEQARSRGTSVREMYRVMVQKQAMGGAIAFTDTEKNRIDAVRSDYDEVSRKRQDIEKKFQQQPDDKDLRQQYDAIRQEENKVTRGLTDIRRAYGGLTNEEMFSGQISADIKLTPEEVKNRDTVLKDITAAKDKQKTLQDSIDKALAELKNLPDPATIKDVQQAAAISVKRETITKDIDRLTTEQNKARSEQQRAEDRAQTIAGGAGLSTGELLDNQRSQKKLTTLTGEERERLQLAQRNYSQAEYSAIRENDIIRSSQRTLQALTGTDDVSKRDRIRLRKDIDNATTKREEARRQMREAGQLVAADAKSRGVTEMEYLQQGRGRISEGDAEEFAKEMARQGRDAPTIMKMIDKMGLTRPEDTVKYRDFVDAVIKRQKEAAAVENTSGLSLIKETLKVYGRDVADSELTSDPAVGKLLPVLNTTEGRRQVQQAISSRSALMDTAKTGAGIFAARANKLDKPDASAEDRERADQLRRRAADMQANPHVAIREMLGDWAKTERARTAISNATSPQEGAEARKAYDAMVQQFRSDYGLLDVRRFADFSSALEFQDKTKFLDFSLTDEKKFSISNFAERVQTMLRGGDLAARGGENERSTMPTNMHVTGDLFIHGDGRATINSYTGRSYRHAATDK